MLSNKNWGKDEGGCSLNICGVKPQQRETDGWMDGWMDGWTDGQTDGRTDGWMDGVKQLQECTGVDKQAGCEPKLPFITKSEWKMTHPKLTHQ